MNTKITAEIAARCLATVDAGLSAGLGEPEPGKMCVEAAINYALGRPHGDDPGCVDSALRAFKIRLNDASWSSPQARAVGMRRLALAQLGSKGTIDTAALVSGLAILAKKWAATHATYAATHATYAATHAAASAATHAAASAATYATYAAYAAYAAEAAASASASYASASASAADAAADAAAEAAFSTYAVRDAKLSAAAEDVVQLLITMEAPGCQWLYLTENAK